MLCEHCQGYGQDAQPYIFYYGNQTGTTYKITHYSIKGSQQVLLCNNCVFTHAMQLRARNFRGSAIAVFVIACVIGIVAFINQDPNGAEIVWLAAALILAYAFSLFLTGLVEKKRAENHEFASLTTAVQKDRGSRLAIEIRKADLQAQDYHAYFTPARLKKIQRIMKAPAKSPAPSPSTTKITEHTANSHPTVHSETQALTDKPTL